MEFLRSVVSGSHFATKLVVGSRNVGCFLMLTFTISRVFTRCLVFVAILNFYEQEEGMELGSKRTRSSPKEPRHIRNFWLLEKALREIVNYSDKSQIKT